MSLILKLIFYICGVFWNALYGNKPACYWAFILKLSEKVKLFSLFALYTWHDVSTCSPTRALCCSICISWPRSPSPCPLWATTACSWSTPRTPCWSSTRRAWWFLCPPTTPCSSTTLRSEAFDDSSFWFYITCIWHSMCLVKLFFMVAQL